MSLPRLPHVVLTLAPTGATKADDREALLTSVASAYAVGPSAVRAGRVCGHCGGTDHGRPWVEVDGSAVGVSLARTSGVRTPGVRTPGVRTPGVRTPGVLALVVGPAGLDVGVDVERVARLAAAPLDAFTPGEQERADGDARVLAACWAAKEAVLKRDGRGLRVDPAAVDVDVPRGVAVFAGAEQPVTFLFPDDDLVVAIAAAGLPVVPAIPTPDRLSAGA